MVHLRAQLTVCFSRGAEPTYVPAPPTGRRKRLRASRRQEFGENFSRLRGVFFGEEVASLHCLSLDIISPLPPDSQRATVLFVEGVKRSADGPKMQHRTRDAPRLFAILVVVLDIQACRRTVLLADRVDPSRIVIRFQVFGSDFGAEGARA